MKVRWKAVAVFVAGLAVGAAGGLAVSRRNVLWLQSMFERIQITEMAIDGQLIEMGRVNQVEQRIAEVLPTFATQLAARLPDQDAAVTLWTVRQYYERTKRTAPPELARILAELPVGLAPLCPKPQTAPDASALPVTPPI